MIHLRPFTPEDIEQVWSLVQRTIGVSYQPDYSPEVIRFFQDYHPREKILDDAENGYIVVAERDGIIVGTGTLREAHIRRVFIEPDCQGQGIGRTIAAHLEERAIQANITKVDLSGALGSRAFWESIGYTVRREVFRSINDGPVIHYYEMARTLAP